VLKDLCKYCHDNGVYMVAYECFEQRWKFPKAYHLFYDLFFKAAVGEKRWKDCLKNNEPFGNANTEAFALMILKNNYHAWMAQAYSDYEFENQYNLEKEGRERQEQEQQENLVDSDDEENRICVIDKLLPNFYYFQVVEQPEEKDDDEEPTEDGQDLPDQSAYSSWTIVTNESDPGTYLKAKQYHERCLHQARRAITDKDLEEYSSGIESLKILGSNVESSETSRRRRSSATAALLSMLAPRVPEEGNEEESSVGDPETPIRGSNTSHAKKKRKILKDLKRFTKKGDCRSPTQKGWSNEGFRYHEELTQQILDEEQDMDKPFVRLYRNLTLKIETRREEMAHPQKKTRYIPDRKTVWQL